MAAVHACFCPARSALSSLEVVSRTGRREVEVSERAIACLGEAPSGCWRGGKAPLCVGPFMAVGAGVCYIEPVV